VRIVQGCENKGKNARPYEIAFWNKQVRACEIKRSIRRKIIFRKYLKKNNLYLP